MERVDLLHGVSCLSVWDELSWFDIFTGASCLGASYLWSEFPVSGLSLHLRKIRIIRAVYLQQTNF